MEREPNKKFLVNFSIDLVVDLPSSWDKDLVNFHFNESSWCSDNFVDLLQEEIDRLALDGGCLCSSLRAKCLDVGVKDDQEADRVT